MPAWIAARAIMRITIKRSTGLWPMLGLLSRLSIPPVYSQMAEACG
jgi:hypothetical protein